MVGLEVNLDFFSLQHAKLNEKFTEPYGCLPLPVATGGAGESIGATQNGAECLEVEPASVQQIAETNLGDSV